MELGRKLNPKPYAKVLGVCLEGAVTLGVPELKLGPDGGSSLSRWRSLLIERLGKR